MGCLCGSKTHKKSSNSSENLIREVLENSNLKTVNFQTVVGIYKQLKQVAKIGINGLTATKGQLFKVIKSIAFKNGNFVKTNPVHVLMHEIFNDEDEEEVKGSPDGFLFIYVLSIVMSESTDESKTESVDYILKRCFNSSSSNNVGIVTVENFLEFLDVYLKINLIEYSGKIILQCKKMQGTTLNFTDDKQIVINEDVIKNCDIVVTKYFTVEKAGKYFEKIKNELLLILESGSNSNSIIERKHIDELNKKFDNGLFDCILLRESFIKYCDEMNS
jgi:hypothetical protein